MARSSNDRACMADSNIPPNSPIGRPQKLVDRVRHAIRLRHYSRRTEEASVYWIRRYIVFHRKRHPSEMGASECLRFCNGWPLAKS